MQEAGILLGAYHYARPENGNNSSYEFNNFYRMIKGTNVRPFLDIEGAALGWAEWCANWLETAKKTFPNVGYYCSKAEVDGRLRILRNKYPLWVAHYDNNDSDGCMHVSGEIITQYTSTPIDMNVAVDMSYEEWYGFEQDSDVNLPDHQWRMIVSEKEKQVIEIMRSL